MTGIQEVQDLARESQLEIIRTGLHNMNEQIGAIGCFAEGDRIELLTRVMVRSQFLRAIKGKLDASLAERLKEVMFEFAYPTPPERWDYFY